MFDLAASGGPGSLGYLGYCPCSRMDPVFGAHSSTLQKGQIFQIIFHGYKGRRGMGNTGTKGDLKEQAQVSAMLTARPHQPRVPPQQGGHRHLGRTGVAFPARSSRVLPSRTAPPFLLPISDPSTAPAPSRAPRGAGQAPRTPSFLPGSRKAPGTTRSWGFSCSSVACSEQDPLNFQGEGALHKAFQTAKIGPKAPILFPCRTKPTKLH